MRLMKLELKQVLKTRMTVILLIFSLVLSLVMAYIPVTFSSVTFQDENGNLETLKGMDAIRYEKALQSDIAGTVTPQKMRRALETYQACMTRYDARYASQLPAEVYAREILPYECLSGSAFLPESDRRWHGLYRRSHTPPHHCSWESFSH